ncbi:MAG TPA: hypothetical protein VMT47_01040 [Polyangia bacterium]|nr:hypothetical protein [Polyangia bacterium]
MNIDEHERDDNEQELLKLLAQGDDDIAAGRGHDLEDVLPTWIDSSRREALHTLAVCHPKH